MFLLEKKHWIKHCLLNLSELTVMTKYFLLFVFIHLNLQKKRKKIGDQIGEFFFLGWNSVWLEMCTLCSEAAMFFKIHKHSKPHQIWSESAMLIQQESEPITGRVRLLWINDRLPESICLWQCPIHMLVDGAKHTCNKLLKISMRNMDTNSGTLTLENRYCYDSVVSHFCLYRHARWMFQRSKFLADVYREFSQDSQDVNQRSKGNIEEIWRI